MLASLRLSLRRAGFGLAGLCLFCIGLAFLTVAAWIALSDLRDALFAATVIGCSYAGLGLIIAVLGMRRPRRMPPPQPVSLAGLGAAFAQGFGAGAATRSSMRHRS
ncbi:phage holin family protein [Pseudooceanicola sp. C21-150M6]|uniref:phage holin family protein n=1 Tax=Pseudooceanicola sp. C21-150M6 TaxID=3434355 RepID=UPI003D7F4E77